MGLLPDETGLIENQHRHLVVQVFDDIVLEIVAHRGGVRKALIAALARKLLIGLWSYAAGGVHPEGVVLSSADQT
jgi:hypothetical protein